MPCSIHDDLWFCHLNLISVNTKGQMRLTEHRMEEKFHPTSCQHQICEGCKLGRNKDTLYQEKSLTTMESL